jgi:hypothetical protein
MQLGLFTNRRSFLSGLASFGFAAGLRASEKPQEKMYRIRTPECEVRMSVQYFGNSLKSFRFRERLSDHSFCLSADGSEGKDCLQGFTGSVAIAYYHLHPHSRTQPLFGFRERVVTIDHDDQMNPRPPFERALAIQRDMVSDIQAFGYSQDLPKQDAQPSAPWCLLRQNLYLNDQSAPFLIVHWKHTLDFIQLVDLIPGAQTEIAEG